MTKTARTLISFQDTTIVAGSQAMQEAALAARDYFLLGTLAEKTHNRDLLLSRYDRVEVERLVQSGHLAWEAPPAYDCAATVGYAITEKGRDAWRTYRFTGP